ncbi:hypothetical protein ACEN33_02335 [Ruoffia sp. FAM 24228]|uniref:hypothetical protein n=1 Tax=Ruoffia sp. FAM 24228 TaxID=3259517 RepID=UPI0038861705
MKISEIFNLNKSQHELDFVDIDTSNDTPLFLDPYFLSLRNDRWSVDAHRTLENYFQFILHLFETNHKEEARRNFKFTEPKETCLGLSKSGTKGKSLGDNDATKLFEYILNSRVVESGLVNHVNDMKIFVDNISHDKISDLTTNVIRKPLIKYTQNQCKLHGLKLTKGVPTREYWDTITRSWISTYEDMLVIEDEPVLLVPKSIVIRKQAYYYDSSMYARHHVLNFLVTEELRLNTSLVRTKTLKNGEKRKSVNKEETAKKYGAYKKEFLRNFTIEHPEFYEDFKNIASKNIETLSNEVILDEYSYEFYLAIIDKLISGFQNINPGAAQANEYHDHVIATMTFLFCPDLINPVKEQEINSGRKRIDLVYDNAAEDGYFFNLSTVKDIPSSYIFVECKNYNKTLSNPDFDQLNGRFSINRGKMGFLVFRKSDDEESLIKRCSDYYKDNKNLIIPLQDSDFIEILKQLQNEEFSYGKIPQQNLLQRLTRKIILS